MSNFIKNVNYSFKILFIMFFIGYLISAVIWEFHPIWTLVDPNKMNKGTFIFALLLWSWAPGWAILQENLEYYKDFHKYPSGQDKFKLEIKNYKGIDYLFLTASTIEPIKADNYYLIADKYIHIIFSKIDLKSFNYKKYTLTRLKDPSIPKFIKTFIIQLDKDIIKNLKKYTYNLILIDCYPNPKWLKSPILNFNVEGLKKEIRGYKNNV